MRWLAYAALAVVQVGALAAGVRLVSVPAQCLLMPVLALVALPLVQHRRRWVGLALGGSFLGDCLPQLVPEHLALPLMLAAFAVGQVGWIQAFRPFDRHSLLVALALVGPTVALVALCWAGAGVIAPAAAGYGALLLTMAAAAGRHGWRGLLGGVLFWVSDAMIALNAFVPAYRVAGIDVAIMATYAAAQGLLAATASRRGGFTAHR